MRPTQHRSNNAVIGAPADTTQEELPCSALAVTRVTYEGGIPAIQSYWVPTAEELKILNNGGAVELSVIGYTMPPVALTAAEF